ncbi:hypothetical protein [Rhizobium etli]|uniref:hypothetical protein n=1 Tax=Rhizobium etli TaxID=29449 RepID=UPI001FD91BE0|nr:hypothetical protein [Rhizobium sp. IE4771]
MRRQDDADGSLRGAAIVGTIVSDRTDGIAADTSLGLFLEPFPWLPTQFHRTARLSWFAILSRRIHETQPIYSTNIGRGYGAARNSGSGYRQGKKRLQPTTSARLNAIIERGDYVWREVEVEIERRNASGYDKATSLLIDLKTIADENGDTADFTRRLHSILEFHARKERLIARLNVSFAALMPS